MPHLIVNGPTSLSGSVRIHGAKNALLPLLAATLIVKGDSVFEDCPNLSDVTAACEILRCLGAAVSVDGGRITVNTDRCVYRRIPDGLMSSMRASVLFAGALLSRFGVADCALPGGCSIGARPIDLHAFAFEALGARTLIHGGRCSFMAQSLKGAEIRFRFASVGATENALLAAVCARGQTVIKNAAREPEIVDLCVFLNSCGAHIVGHGTDTVTVIGVRSLHGAVHRVVFDRIVSATYIAAAATTGSSLTLRNVSEPELAPVVKVFSQMGVVFSFSDDTVFVDAEGVLRCPKAVTALPHPGFPTDAAPLVAAAMCTAEGGGYITDGVFDNRFSCWRDFNRLGAATVLIGSSIAVGGVKNLYAADVTACDLRAAAALVCLALAARGKSKISNTEFLERGYDALHEDLKRLGADIERIA